MEKVISHSSFSHVKLILLTFRIIHFRAGRYFQSPSSALVLSGLPADEVRGGVWGLTCHFILNFPFPDSLLNLYPDLCLYMRDVCDTLF